MFRMLALLSALSLLSVPAEAASSSTIGTIDCAGDLSISLLDAASFSCAGNFSLSGGVITSDAKVVIAASGSLILESLSIVAPVIELSTQGGYLSIGAGVLIIPRSFLADIGSGVMPTLLVPPQASISVGSGAAARIVGHPEILVPISRGVITPLVGGELSITPSVPEPAAGLSTRRTRCRWHPAVDARLRRM